MMTDKKVVTCAETLVAFCKERMYCQNCVFRKFGAGSWRCHIGEPQLWDLKEVASNAPAADVAPKED